MTQDNIGRSLPTQAAISYLPILSDRSYISHMQQNDSVRELVAERAKAEGLSLKDLSLAAGKNHAYFQQFIERGVPRVLPEEIRESIAPMLKLEPGQLKGQKPRRNAPDKTSPVSNATIGGNIPLSAKVPAYGHARGGRDGQFVLNGNKVGDVLAPPSLAQVPDAYAVYVAGTSMQPRYFPGEIVFVHPGLPVRAGDFVIAQIATSVEGDAPEAYVKQFVSMDEKRLRLAQLNPKKVLTFPSGRVVSVHKIIMGGIG